MISSMHTAEAGRYGNSGDLALLHIIIVYEISYEANGILTTGYVPVCIAAVVVRLGWLASVWKMYRIRPSGKWEE
jgi:hypothetical protein